MGNLWEGWFLRIAFGQESSSDVLVLKPELAGLVPGRAVVSAAFIDHGVFDDNGRQ
jgi:hypothetical protein